jgi:ATP-dependent Clp protease ATP-binding subunit ClpC
MKRRITDELRRTFRPEFLNRIDETIVFHALTEEHIKDIVSLMLKVVADRMKENEVEVEVAEAVKGLLVREGFDEAYGARPLRRAILRFVEDRLSEELLRGTFRRGDRVLLDLDETGKETKVVKL